MAIPGQALLVLPETQITTGGKKFCARILGINHPVGFMQTLQYLLYVSTVMVSLYVSWFIQHYTIIICITGCDHLALIWCCVKRHMLIHSSEHIRCVGPLGKHLVLVMPFKCTKCDLLHELRASIMQFNYMKCDKLIIYLPCKLYNDTKGVIHYIKLSVWECRLLEIRSSKCQ